MSRRHDLSPGGVKRYRQWRDSSATTSQQAALVLTVLNHIAEHGWPPTEDTPDGPPAPRWLYFRPNENPQDWIVAPTDDLWITIHLNDDSTFDFVNAYQPDGDYPRPVPWLTEPSPDD